MDRCICCNEPTTKYDRTNQQLAGAQDAAWQFGVQSMMCNEMAVCRECRSNGRYDEWLFRLQSDLQQQGPVDENPGVK
jgi:hypothetical protein